MNVARSCTFALAMWLWAIVLSARAAQCPLADAAEKSDRSAIRALLKQHADVYALELEDGCSSSLS